MSFLPTAFHAPLWGNDRGRACFVRLRGHADVLATFLLGRELSGKGSGWLAALVLTFSAYHIHFSRLASNQIFDPLIGALAFWLLWRAMRGSSLTVWGLSGWWPDSDGTLISVRVGSRLCWPWSSAGGL
jgi:hypothetical protein